MVKSKSKSRVAVAMSGGVDSSVAAALLLSRGYDVTGFFMYFWHDQHSGQPANRCCAGEAEQQARAVARKLTVPFYTLDFKGDFKRQVVDNFLAEHQQLFTPNPCVVCNKKIKFGLLLDKIRQLGFDYLATGHYVKKLKVKSLKLKVGRDEANQYKLLKAKDKTKDQSYFLYNLSQEQLRNLLFPLGKYTKKEARRLADDFGLPTASTRESQDICFVGDSVEEFLARHSGYGQEGAIINTAGEEIGRHQGLLSYTIGQRKGIKVGGSGPYYVLERDYRRNVLVVINEEKDKKLYSDIVTCDRVSWVSGQEPALPLAVEAVVRYNAKPVAARVFREGRGYEIKLADAQRAVMPGQSVVFYQGDELLGGGVIRGAELRHKM